MKTLEQIIENWETTCLVNSLQAKKYIPNPEKGFDYISKNFSDWEKVGEKKTIIMGVHCGGYFTLLKDGRTISVNYTLPEAKQFTRQGKGFSMCLRKTVEEVKLEWWEQSSFEEYGILDKVK